MFRAPSPALSLAALVVLTSVLSTTARGADAGPHADEEEAMLLMDDRLSLRAALQSALQLAPGQAGLVAETDAAEQLRRRGRSLGAGAPSLQLRYLSDRLQTRQGVSETEVGFDLPIWRWNQRQALALEAGAAKQGSAENMRLHQWQVAGQVREAYWELIDAQQRVESAALGLAAFEQLEADVIRRIAAGDAAPAERLTAEGQRRDREAVLHEAEVMMADRHFNWRVITGLDAVPVVAPETIAAASAYYLPLEAAKAGAALADAALRTARAEAAGSPRLMVGVRTDTQDGADDINSLSAQLNLPFGGSRHREAALAPVRLQAARSADQVALMEQEARLARHEAEHELHAREVALSDARTRLSLANQELTLARRAYSLGELSLSERLLVEIRSADAERNHALAIVAQNRAIARFNQINGVLP